MCLPYKATRPQTKCKPGVACGCGVTAKLGPEHHARERQTYLFGTALQVASYGRRVAVESFNAELSLHRGKLQRGTARCFMANKTELLLAIYIAATNCCIIRDYCAMHPDLMGEDGDDSAALCHVPKVARRRKPRKEGRHRLLAAVGLAT